MYEWVRCSGKDASFIDNASWKVRVYGIYARVVDISEIERVSAAVGSRIFFAPFQRVNLSTHIINNNSCFVLSMAPTSRS